MEKLKNINKIHKIRGFTGFKDFLKNQGVVTLAIGFILGTAISKFVSSLVTDIINPIINFLLGGVDNLGTEVIHIGKSTIHYGTFINNGIDFITIALVVYVGVRLLRLDQEQLSKTTASKVVITSTTPKK